MKNIISPIVSDCQTLQPQQVEKPFCAVGTFIMEVIWKDVEGFNGKYKISSAGNVLSTSFKRSNSPKLLKPIERRGYLKVTIYLSPKNCKQINIHRLVATHFLPIDAARTQVNHKDGNKKNNDVSNLEFCTAKENISHAIENNLRRTSYELDRKSTKLSNAQFFEIKRRLTAGERVCDIANHYGVHQSLISKFKHNTLRKHLL